MSSKVNFKIVIGGDGGVGKTTMLHRYVEGKFLVDTIITIGVGFYSKTIEIDDNSYSLTLWDFGGEEHFRLFLNSYVQGARGAFIAFDLTRQATLKKIEQWVNIVRREDPNIPIVFIGTKLDLKEKISVPDDLALELKEKYGFAAFIKTSSKTGENVKECFEILTKAIIKYYRDSGISV